MDELEVVGAETLEQTRQPTADQMRHDVEVLNSQFRSLGQEAFAVEASLQTLLSSRNEFQLKLNKFEDWLSKAEDELRLLSKPIDKASIEQTTAMYEVEPLFYIQDGAFASSFEIIIEDKQCTE